MILASCIATLLVSPAAMAQIYKIVHPDGRVEYTDEPPMDREATEVALPQLIIQPGVALPEPVEPATPDNGEELQPATLTVNAPLDETVVHGSGQRASFSLNARNVPEGSQFQLIQNGAPVSTHSGANFQSPVLFPGTQTFSVNLLSEQGEILTRSAPIRIYVIP